ncbi:fimbrial protein [Enterobacter sp. 22466]|uniref:fimbrial protein n=1 Tax=Enterobacter sp. 22466 TaxID=3453924 RepID=UPI003F824313
MNVKYVTGGDLKISDHTKDIPAPRIKVGYCTSSGDGNAGQCVYMVDKPISPNLVDGTHTWAELIDLVQGKYQVPTSPYKSDAYCVSAWIADAAYMNDLSFGTEYYSSDSNSLCAAYVSPPPPDLCYINAGNNPITVDFGAVERFDIGIRLGSDSDVNHSLTVNCQGENTHKIDVKLDMTPTSWSSGQIATSNPALGVSISVDGKQLKNNDSFTMSVNGSNTTDLAFSLLRNPDSKPTDIATGSFHASATLIVTEP